MPCRRHEFESRRPVHHTVEKQMYYVFDLDGTLSDDKQRQHFRTQEPKDWNAYNNECDKDTVIHETLEIIDALYNSKHTVEIWTGRTENQRLKTITWLSIAGIPYNDLRMRPNGDHRAASVLKIEWLNNSAIKPDLVFEDRETQVQYWLDAGIDVLLLKRA